MTCETCRQDKTVTLEHSVRAGRRLVSWRICGECTRAERAQQDGRAQVAIQQAEKAGA